MQLGSYFIAGAGEWTCFNSKFSFAEFPYQLPGRWYDNFGQVKVLSVTYKIWIHDVSPDQSVSQGDAFLNSAGVTIPNFQRTFSPIVLPMHSTSKMFVVVGKRVISSSDRLYKQSRYYNCHHNRSPISTEQFDSTPWPRSVPPIFSLRSTCHSSSRKRVTAHIHLLVR